MLIKPTSRTATGEAIKRRKKVKSLPGGKVECDQEARYLIILLKSNINSKRELMGRAENPILLKNTY